MLPIFVLTGCLQTLFSYNIINISKFGEKYMTNREKFEDIFGFTPSKEVNYGTNDPEGVITIPVVLTVKSLFRYLVLSPVFIYVQLLSAVNALLLIKMVVLICRNQFSGICLMLRLQ